jgi:NADH-quinone oxidoreductase subunit C
MGKFSPSSRGLDAIAARVSEVLRAKILSQQIAFEDLTITVAAGAIVEVVTRLRDDPELRFISFVDLCGVDYPEREKRFDVVYHFLSPQTNHRIRIKVQTDADIPVPSISDVFPAATWFEREAYDFYGILFSGNPDFRRILTDYGFRGHPLRKDFPLTGFVEVRYSNEQKRVVYEPVKLPQEFRNFDFLSPWEGTDYVLPGDEKKSA